MSEVEANSWGAERALVMSKIDEFSRNQIKLFEGMNDIRTSVAVLSTKLLTIGTVVSIVLPIIVSVIAHAIDK